MSKVFEDMTREELIASIEEKQAALEDSHAIQLKLAANVLALKETFRPYVFNLIRLYEEDYAEDISDEVNSVLAASPDECLAWVRAAMISGASEKLFSEGSSLEVELAAQFVALADSLIDTPFSADISIELFEELITGIQRDAVIGAAQQILGHSEDPQYRLWLNEFVALANNISNPLVDGD